MFCKCDSNVSGKQDAIAQEMSTKDANFCAYRMNILSNCMENVNQV